MQAINEELRSTTEELETGKEELQSVNEELVTVNQELKIKIEEFSQSNNDFQNLINSSHNGTIFLDRHLRIKLFTPAASEIFNLIPADVGRLLSDITHKIIEGNLIADVVTVLDNLQPIEQEIRTVDDKIYLMQITPYRTAEDRISGSIIAFVNITKSKEQEIDLRKLNERFERQVNIFNTTLSNTSDYAYIFDKEGRFMFGNKPLLDFLNITSEEFIGKTLYELNYPGELADRILIQIQQVFDEKEEVKDETAFMTHSGVEGFFEYILNPVFAPDGSVELVVGSTRDITKNKYREANLAFKADFSQSLVALSNGAEILQMFGEKISKFLGASKCAFFEINEKKDIAAVKYEWHRSDSPELSENYKIPELSDREFQEMMMAGRTMVVPDVQQDPFVGDNEQFEAFGIGSFVKVPLIRDNVWKFILAVYHDQPYKWREDQVALLNDLANYIWTKLERLNAQKELKESEERLQALVKNLPGGAAFIVDRELRFLLADGEALTRTNMRTEDIVGKTVAEVLDAQQAEIYTKFYESALLGKTLELEHQKEDRTYLVKGTPLYTAKGKIYAALALTYDITEHQKAEATLRKSEQWLSLIMKSIKDYAIITTDVSGIINGWNPGAEKMFGYTESEILGKNSEILFTPEDREKDVASKEILVATEKGSAEDERYHVRKDGSRFFVTGLMHPIQDGEINGFVKIARDITEKLKVEEIKRDKKMLQKLVGAQEDERRRIARDLHDELGQLLTALRLQLESAKNLCEDNEEICAKIEESQLLAKQVDNGIDFFAWELRPAALDDFGLYAALGKYIREWSHYSGVSAELLESGIKKLRFASEIETNLYRITQESLNNVYKHAEAKHVEIILEKRGEIIVLIIEDNGKGFEPKKKMNRPKGIGLIGMKERATLIGGSLEIESSSGKGTTIFVRVPASLTKKGESNDRKT